MSVFVYAGVQSGKKVSGEINASDARAAQIELRKKKIIVTGIKKSSKKQNPVLMTFQLVMRLLFLKMDKFI